MRGVWGWTPARSEGIWRFGPKWLHPAVAAAPWLMVMLLLEMLHLLGGTLTSSEGVLFDLPDAAPLDGAVTPLVAVAMPVREETVIFFDDARYVLGDGLSAASFGEHLAERLAHVSEKSLLVLADRRVPGGDLSKIAALSRAGGAKKLLFANKQPEARTE